MLSNSKEKLLKKLHVKLGEGNEAKEELIAEMIKKNVDVDVNMKDAIMTAE